MINAVVFDFDGVILDTETLSYQATAEVYKQYGAELPISYWAKIAGSKDDAFDSAEHLESVLGHPIDRAAYIRERDDMIMHYVENAQVLPGVVAILETAKKLGMKIGLATSSGDQWAKNHLSRIGLIDYFDVIVEANDVENVKPDPELFSLACERLGVQPNEAIAFEDSLNGAIAARKAGLYVVVVPNEITKNLSFDDVDQKLHSLAETNLEALIELFSKGDSVGCKSPDSIT
ncbi:HAD family hydrolase [Camelliibacillus cellulosilyticus]|uniref:HAD family hydrolase n=1 Tax=Camelliibacillus cellulosilyticus TaxID=2174486 RepID=A0ABV9GM10_9BACL